MLALSIAWCGSVLLPWSQIPAQAQGVPAASSGPIVVLGDSLSAEYGIARGAGWVELLRARLREQGDRRTVVNASVSGETSAGGRSRIDALLRRQHPSLLILELGGNDALRGLDLAASRANLGEIVRRAQQAGARVVILGMKVPPNYGKAYGESFERLFADLARETGASLVPFFLEGIAERLDLFQADRIHPNETAQPMMLERVWPVLKGML